MNNEERELINTFFDRIAGKNSAQSGSASMVKQLPPIDPEADRLITDNFQKNAEAGYRVTQMAVVQEAALVEAQNQIRQLQWQLQQATQQLQQTQQQQAQRPAAGGFLGGLFGGAGNKSQQAAPPPPGWGNTPMQQQEQGQPRFGQQQGVNNNAAPPPNYPPGYQQGMFNRGGTGFLGSALTTAAGVAGGMMAYNALSGLFGGHSVGGAAAPVADPAAGAADPFTGGDPFSGAGGAVDPGFDAGGMGGTSDTDFGGTGGQDSSWDSAGGDDGGGDDGGWSDGF